MKQDRFFNRSRDWSHRKHRLLRKYLIPFSAKLGSWNINVFCIDGFAGVGRYGDQTDGSPLIMAQMADECLTWKKPVSLRIINVEAKHAHFDELVRNTQSWAIRGIVKNIQGKFGEVAPSIVREIGTSPALFFIDPYGPSKAPFYDLLPILKRNVKATELIINFDADGLRRLADRIQKNVRTIRGLKGAETTIGLVSKILGTDSWIKEFETGELSTQEREDVLLKAYLNKLSEFNYYVVAYPIREAIGKAPKYYIVFCTRHLDGIMLWNNFICEEESQLTKETTFVKPGQTGSLFNVLDPVQEQEDKRREELGIKLLGFLDKQSSTTRGKIKRHFILNQFGRFHEKDYNAVVKELINTNKVQTGTGKKQINDDVELFYMPQLR